MHDPLDAWDLVSDEIAQRRETGHDVATVERRLAGVERGNRDGLLRLYADVIALEQAADWPYDEPSALPDILRRLPIDLPARPIDRDRLPDQILGGWLGRIAGCNVGKPVEWGPHWTPAHLRDYLERAGAYPLRGYIPVLDPMPAEFVLRDCWPETRSATFAARPATTTSTTRSSACTCSRSTARRYGPVTSPRPG